MPAPTSKSDTVYQQLRSRIVDGQYTPGFRLTFSALAEEFGVSTVPVREAIRSLEAEGLVEYTLNIGARVSEVNLEDYYESMVSLALLEGMATALAAPHITEDDLQIAYSLNRDMEALTRSSYFDSDAYRRLNGRFHSVLCAPCPNSRIVSLVTNEAERVTIIRRSSLKFESAQSVDSIAQHDHLLDLIRTGADPAEIESFARQHKMASLHSKVSTPLRSL